MTLNGSAAQIAHDAAGNMTHLPFSDDPENHDYYIAIYDGWNRLVAVQSSAQSPVAEYQYDGRGFRIAKTVGGTRTDFYYNSSWQVLEERTTVGEATVVAAQYVWDLRYIDAPVLRDGNLDGDDETGDLGVSGSGLDERLFFVQDANFNTTAVVDGTPGGHDRWRRSRKMALQRS